MNISEKFATPWADNQAIQAEELARRLQECQTQAECANITAAREKVAFKSKYAKAIVEIKGSGEKVTEALADAKAMIYCEEEYRNYELSQAVARSAASAVQTLQSECDLWRSTASAKKLEIELTNQS